MAQLLLQRPLLRPLPAIGASSAPAHAARCTRRRWTCTLCAAETAGSPAVVQAAVGVMTGLLRLGRGSSRCTRALCCGRSAWQVMAFPLNDASRRQEPAAPRRLDGARDVDALMALLRDDFEQHAYFVTGAPRFCCPTAPVLATYLCCSRAHDSSHLVLWACPSCCRAAQGTYARASTRRTAISRTPLSASVACRYGHGIVERL
jgi:hypothetical protein